MIKKPAELKTAFSNGALPDQDDFGDLIDSFLPRDSVSDQDLAALRAMAVWWRNGGQGNPTPRPAGPGPRPAPDPGQDPEPAPSGPPSSQPTSLDVAADGSWARLPVTTAQPGIWLCSVSTVNPRPGYAVSGNAIAVVDWDEDGGGKRLLQCMERDSLLPWRTFQFAWRLIDGSDRYYLALRARWSFGADSNGADARIHCTIQPSDAHA